MVLGLIKAWERNQYVVNRFKGEIFCSGYGIWIDYRINPEGHRRLFEIMERCDGERTVADIADELGISFQAVWEVVALLQEQRNWLAEPHALSTDQIPAKNLVNEIGLYLPIKHDLKARSAGRRAGRQLPCAGGLVRCSRLPAVLGNAMPKSGSHLIIQVLQGLTRWAHSSTPVSRRSTAPKTTAS